MFDTRYTNGTRRSEQAQVAPACSAQPHQGIQTYGCYRDEKQCTCAQKYDAKSSTAPSTDVTIDRTALPAVCARARMLLPARHKAARCDIAHGRHLGRHAWRKRTVQPLGIGEQMRDVDEVLGVILLDEPASRHAACRHGALTQCTSSPRVAHARRHAGPCVATVGQHWVLYCRDTGCVHGRRPHPNILSQVMTLHNVVMRCGVDLPDMSEGGSESAES